jgi:DNA-directed RNA polymerase subunit RPC12/RpoP
MTARQAEMFAKPPAQRRHRAHIVQAGSDCASFACGRCGWLSGWIAWPGRRVAAAKRGIECPRCNEGGHDGRRG